MIYRRADVVVRKDEDAGIGAEGDEGSKPSNGKAGAEGLGQGAQCIWLARVRPEDCEGIIKFTVLQGKVVKPESQLRGGFDRGKMVTSW